MRCVCPAESVFPAFLELRGRVCVVVGAGRAAEPKIAALLVVGAAVRVVAPRASHAVRAWAREGRICWLQRGFLAADADGASVILAAAGDPIANAKASRAALTRRIAFHSANPVTGMGSDHFDHEPRLHFFAAPPCLSNAMLRLSAPRPARSRQALRQHLA